MIKKLNFNKGLAFDSILLTVVKFLTTALSVIISMILSRKLSLNEYGTYSQALLLVSFFISLSILGLADAINYFINKYSDEERNYYVSTIIFIEIIVGLIAGIIILTFNNYITLFFNNNELKKIYLLIAFFPMITNLNLILQIIYIAAKRSKEIAIKNLIVSLFKLITVLISTYVFRSLLVIFIFQILIEIIQFLYFASNLSKCNINIKFKYIKSRYIIPIFKYSLPLAIYIFISSLYKDIDKFVVAKFANTEALAIFSNASKYLPFDIFATSFLTVMIPYITKYVIKNDKDNLVAIYKNYFNFAIITTWTFSSGAIIVSNEMIRFLYGEQYVSGLNVFIIYILVDMLKFFSLYLILSAKNKGKILAFTTGIFLVFNLVLDLVFYNILGQVGVALVTLFLTLLNNCALIKLGLKYTNIKFFEIFDFKLITSFALNTIFISIIMLIIKSIIKKFINYYLIIFILIYSLYILIMFVIYKNKVITYLNNLNALK